MQRKAIVPALLALAALLVPASGVLASSVSSTITMQFDLSAQDSSRETRLWIPYPTSDEDQTISRIRVTGDYQQCAVYTDKVHQTPMLYAEWPAQAKSRKLDLFFTVDREEVVRRDFPAWEGAWDPADYALYLAPTGLAPRGGRAEETAARITRGKSTVLAKARAIYDWTCENTFRDPETRGCGTGDICKLMEKPGGKCVDISSLFVALARAAGVPAREVLGIRQGKGDAQDITTWQHCWAEFFLPGYGWVPVDPADVRKMMLTQNLKAGDAKTAEYREYFWGGLDAYRVRLSRGRDLTLNPRQEGAPVNYLMYPFAQIGDKTLDWLAPETFRYTIAYEKSEG
ncbi:MAG: transglutaminase domain-containing protein [Thermodesulfobacteriota bacterium]